MKKQKPSPRGIQRTIALLLFLAILPANPSHAQEPKHNVYLPLVLKAGSSFKEFFASADVEISYFWSINFGTSPSMRVGFDSIQENTYRSLVQFPLEALSASCNVKSAEILIYYYEFSDNPYQTRTITAYQVLEAWDEMEVTGYNVPAKGGAIGSFDLTSVLNGFGYHGFDASVIVSKWLSQELPNYGILLAGTGNYDPEAFRRFYTREGKYPPKMIVECGQ